ncbi:hypothetical protein KK062_30250, partial [Fulvivirgaceae bacterium PWU5]
MKKKTIFMLSSCTVFSASLIVTLYATSYLVADVYRGPFYRNIKYPESIPQVEKIDLKYNSYY